MEAFVFVKPFSSHNPSHSPQGLFIGKFNVGNEVRDENGHSLERPGEGSKKRVDCQELSEQIMTDTALLLILLIPMKLLPSPPSATLAQAPPRSLHLSAKAARSLQATCVDSADEPPFQ